jgi:hypothetical protein
MPKRRKRRSSRRWLVWLAAFAAGMGIGIAGYRWLPPVVLYFDYWVELALS